MPPAAMALAEVTRTWNVERGLFAGEGGRLLAAAVGASSVSLEAVAGALVRPLPRSVFEHEATAGLVGHVDGVIVAGRGVFLNGDASRADAGVGEDGVRVPGAAAGGSGEPDWLLLYPNALPDGPVATSSDALPYVVTSADPAHAPVVDHDPFAEARAFARQIRRLAGDEGEGAATGPEGRAAPVVVDGPPPVHLLLERGPADGFADGGSGAPAARRCRSLT
ncbi:MAG: hypothetical protein M5U09_05115 [Gammaproteobacteria bacterium]|nr:hypothetical protein [Gammaproteobacteria bacterium]